MRIPCELRGRPAGRKRRVFLVLTERILGSRVEHWGNVDSRVMSFQGEDTMLKEFDGFDYSLYVGGCLAIALMAFFV